MAFVEFDRLRIKKGELYTLVPRSENVVADAGFRDLFHDLVKLAEAARFLPFCTK